MAKKMFLGFLIIGAISMIVMSLHYFQHESTGIMKNKEVSSLLWYRIILRTHIASGLLGITTGPFQFIERLRHSSTVLHRKIGYVYVISILTSATTGLIAAQFAMGGWISTLGFSFLAIAWFLITMKAVQAILCGDKKLHKLLMTFSYALTFAAIPQRTLLLIPLFFEVSFIPIYQLSAWLPWLFNLLIAYLIISISEKRKTTAT